MDKYYLTEDELNGWAIINGLNKSMFGLKGTLSTDKKTFDDRLFNHLLQVNSELKPLYDDFCRYYPNAILRDFYPNTFFAKTFANKIEFDDMGEYIFKQYHSYKGDQKNRSNLFKHWHEKTPKFLPMLHNYLKNLKPHTSEEEAFDVYFQILKSKKTDRSAIDSSEILENIKKFAVGSNKELAKKKINAYIALFEANQFLYDFIMDDMGDLFKRSGSIKNIWEEKLNKFPKNISSQFNDSIPQTPMFNDSISFMYHFEMNKEWVVEHSKVSDKLAFEFCERFHDALERVLQKNIKSMEPTFSVNRGTQLNLKFKDEEGRQKAKEITKLITSQSQNILNSYPWQSSYGPKMEYLDKFIEKFMLSYQLDKELSTQEVKKVKHKI